MADIAASNWSETDNNNNTASPDGMPEGMAPSGVNNTGRAIMGALKRFWNKSNAVKTTGGTTSAYTLSFDVAPGAYYDGEIISFIVNATNAAAATLNVNALGAVPLRLFAGNLLAGALLANQIVTARYSTSAGAFDIIPQNGWVRLGTQDPSAAATVDFTGIPAGVNHIRCEFEVKPGTDNVSLDMRTYDAAGNLDSGATDYLWNALIWSSGASSPTLSSATASSIVLTSFVGNGDTGVSGWITAQNIQAATFTKFKYQTDYSDEPLTTAQGLLAHAWRGEADRITGIRLLVSSGTMTGKATLFASA